MTATISVVVPAYNHERFVGETIRSLVTQTRQPDELIVVDDASTDHTWDEIQRCVPSIPFPIITRRHTKNAGLASTLNDALSSAQSDFVALVASDDTYPPDKIESQLAFLVAHPEFGAVYGDLAIMNEFGEHVRVDRPLTRELNVSPREGFAEVSLEEVALGRSGASNQTAVFRRAIVAAIGGFDENLILEDFDFVLRLLRTARAAHLFQPGANYRTLASGFNRRFREFDHEYEISLSKHRSFLETRGVSWSTVLGANWLRRANTRLNADDQAGALYCSVRSLIEAPKNPAAWKCAAQSCVPAPIRRGLRRVLRGSGH
jgi:glycosyltransferase involved in cell wall biosynthesis